MVCLTPGCRKVTEIRSKAPGTLPSHLKFRRGIFLPVGAVPARRIALQIRISGNTPWLTQSSTQYGCSKVNRQLSRRRLWWH